MNRLIFSCCLLSAMLMGCSREPATPLVTPDPARPASGGVASRADGTGSALYSEHCAQCHGPEAQGHPDWQTPNDGTFAAAPPLNSSGPAVRRTKQELLKTIKQGVRRGDVDIMPAYGTRLSAEEIDAILAWFQSLWPAEVREAWLQTNAH